MSFFRAIYPNFSRQDGYTYAFQSIIYQYDKKVTDGIPFMRDITARLGNARAYRPRHP